MKNIKTAIIASVCLATIMSVSACGKEKTSSNEVATTTVTTATNKKGAVTTVVNPNETVITLQTTLKYDLAFIDIPITETNTSVGWVGEVVEEYQESPFETFFQLQHRDTTLTDEEGFRRINGNVATGENISFYQISIPQAYSPKAGETFRITLDNGTVFEAMNCYTQLGRLPLNGDLEVEFIEFIVDRTVMTDEILSKPLGETFSKFNGKVVKIEKISAVTAIQ